ncbi:MAG: c-type cytochrome, partial [Crocinitomicaceae bacterium]
DKDKMELSDGQMFYSISYGKGKMGAHASLLSKEEIWVLVHYVRSLQYGDAYDGTAVSSTAPAAPVENTPAVKNDVKKKGKK